MSFGSPPGADDVAFRQAVDRAYNAGAVIIAAAGDINVVPTPTSTVYPSDFGNTISVINVTHTTNLTLTNLSLPSFPPSGWTEWEINTNPRNITSCYGTAKDISAPGTYVWSTVPTDLPATQYFLGSGNPYNRPGYDTRNGTSIAAPVVAGVAAMVRFADPALTPAQVASILYDTATDVHIIRKDDQTGYGVVNAAAAVQRALPSSVISLNRSGSHVFAAKTIGYGNQTPLSVKVTNNGSQSTGDLTVELSGINAGSFTLSTSALSSIAVNGNIPFTVVPNTGLARGTYSATVTVSGVNVSAQSFNVAFTVNRAAGASLQSNPVRDTTVTTNRHNSITIKPVLPSAPNTGNQWVEYAVSKNTTVPPGGWQTALTFTGLQPNTSYHVFARASASDTNNAGAVRRTTTAIKTLEAPYVISLNKSGTFALTSANFNYGTRSAQAIKVNNTGTTATGDLDIVLSGLDAGSFEIVTPASQTLKSIGKGSSRSFTIRPVEGLKAGTYSATVTVSNANVTARSFNVSFKVNKGSGAGVTAVGGFPESGGKISVDGVSLNPATHPGGQTIQYAITTSNATTMPSNLVWQTASDFTELRPSTNYYIWARSAANNNCNAGTARRSAAITTMAPDESVRLSIGSTDLTSSGLHTFAKANFNYNDLTASQRKIMVTALNNGRLQLPTEQMTVFLTGPDATSFTLSEFPSSNIQTLSLSSIAAGAAAPPFPIVPRTGLSGGTHDATVVVRRISDSCVMGTFNIRFTVNRTAGAAVSGAPTAQNRTPHSITVNAVTSKDALTNQKVQYAVTTSTSATAPSNLKWQDSPTFTGLRPLTAYRVWARTAINPNSNAGAAVRSAAIRTGGIELNRTGRHTFTSRSFTSTTRNPLSVSVMNRGTEPTGSLTVALSGDKFTLSTDPGTNIQTLTLSTVAAGTPATFTVVPRTGISVGTHNATVTVSGTDGAAFSAKFNVRFVVSRGTGAAVSAAPTALGSVHNALVVTPLTVPSNPGNQHVEYAISKTKATPISGWQTGQLFIGLSTNTSYYVFARTAKNADCNAGAVQRSAAIRTTVPEHAVTLNRTGTYKFSAARLNYSARTALSVKVTNVGTEPTGMLTITLSGDNPGSYEIVSPTATTPTRSLASIAKKANRSFTIRPRQGLAIGTHTATVIVKGEHGIFEAFEVSFTVNKAKGAAVSNGPTQRRPIDIGSINLSFNSVTVPSNPWNQTVEYAISTSTKTPATGWFTLHSFTGLTPSTKYYIFARTKENDYCEAGAVKRGPAIRTNAENVAISLNRTGTYNFAAATYGYGTCPALRVNVNNTGLRDTNTVTITLSGTNPGSFELSTPTASLPSIARNGSDNFTIRPKLNLNAGTYTARVSVFGGGYFSRIFDVSFTVNKAPGAVLNDALAVAGRDTNRITLDVTARAPVNPGGQGVEYAISTTTVLPTTGWDTNLIFTGLQPTTTYYIFARTRALANYDSGPAKRIETRTS